MSQILVRDLEPETVEQLKARAKANRRSLQAEVRSILEAAAEAEVGSRRSRAEMLRIADDIRRRAGPQHTDSTQLIREDREDPNR